MLSELALFMPALVAAICLTAAVIFCAVKVRRLKKTYLPNVPPPEPVRVVLAGFEANFIRSPEETPEGYRITRTVGMRVLLTFANLSARNACFFIEDMRLLCDNKPLDGETALAQAELLMSKGEKQVGRSYSLSLPQEVSRSYRLNFTLVYGTPDEETGREKIQIPFRKTGYGQRAIEWRAFNNGDIIEGLGNI